MTIQTNPLSPSRATWKPEVVNTLIVARSEMFRGAALPASATSASRGIMYSLRAGYLGLWAQVAETSKLANNKSSTKVDFFISFPFVFVSLCLYYAAQVTKDTH